MQFKFFPKLAIILALISFQSIAQNLSPSQFLGYELGEKFTRHHQIQAYIEYLAKNNNSQSKVIPYGKTAEGRMLMVCVIASKENFANIETIRTNNLKSIGLMEGTATAKLPAIAWLSYNVHGNEAVSSEAVLKVAYDLLDQNNTVSQKILKNTVVILDPCINPDGRDRYANWYNQKVGNFNDANPASWEHNETWPSGRYNHYMFDLNRDWAWQVQDESRARVQLYNTWMPHLHADFHEQGYNSPYYFAPSAKPYHEDISIWQREFQQKLGTYNKRDFDKNGWLYFSNERFDLLYPSYGDTYPTFNGAFGMTYEQGGIRAGLAIVKNDGDTLTLQQRISHHHSTSYAAMEALSDNAEKSVNEFVKYFETSKTNPSGNFKSYIIKLNENEGKVRDFTALLDRLNIQYSQAGKSYSANGFSYIENANIGFNVDANDLLISSYQPKSVMLKVLMEPKTMVEDSSTYDITAWSLPYAYGLNTYALKEKLVGKPFENAFKENIPYTGARPYAYLAKWNAMNDCKFLAALLQSKIKVRTSEIAFEINGKKYAKGTLVITRAGNENLGLTFDEKVNTISNKNQINLELVQSGMVTKGFDFGSSNLSVIKSNKIAVLSGENTNATSFGEVWHFFDKQIQYPVTIIGSDYLNKIDLNKYDILILPNGNYGSIVTEKTSKKIEDWVRNGGKLILMENAIAAFIGKGEFEIKKRESKKDTSNNAQLYENREKESISEETPGSIYKVTMDNSHPLAFGYDKTYFSLALEVSEYMYLKSGWNVGTIKENDLVAGFVGQKAKAKLKNTLIFGVQGIGSGNVIYMANNPLFRGFWQNGKQLFTNAVFIVD